MDYSERPVFIIASERSGTNLLRRRLTEAQSFYLGPSPAHFLKHLYYQQPYYGDLDEDSNFLVFVGQALDLCFVHFSPWDVSWTPEEILTDYADRDRDAIGLMHFLMNKYALVKGYQGYICKDNFLYEFALEIERQIPGAKFIYLYRDPRDFVLSQIKRPGAIKSVVRFARLWAYEQTKAIQACSKLRLLNKCQWLSYERLITDENRVIKELLAFIEVQPAEDSSYQEKTEIQVHDWKNLNKPTDASNSGKFREELTHRQIAAIETQTSLQMRFLGYSKDLPNKSLGSLYMHMDIFFAMARKALSKIISVGKKSSNEEAAIRNKRSVVLSRVSVNYRSDS